MGMLGNMIKKYFESRELRYTELPDDDVVLRVGFNGKNKPTLETLLIIDEDTNTLHLRSYNYCNAPEDKKPEIYKLCSDMNKKFQWVKFYVDEVDNTITLEDDAMLAPENCGDEALGLTIRMIEISDVAYPFFMKILWG